MTKKITIEDILKKKEILEDKKVTPYHSKLFDGDIEIKDVPIDDIISMLETVKNDSSMDMAYNIVYTCCPIFQSKKLQEEFNIKDPIDIVSVLYKNNIGELSELVSHIMARYGIYLEELAVKIKKQ